MVSPSGVGMARFDNITTEIPPEGAGEAYGNTNIILTAENDGAKVGRFAKFSNGKLVPMESADDTPAGVVLRDLTMPVDTDPDDAPLVDYLVKGLVTVEADPVEGLPEIGARLYVTADGRVSDASGDEGGD